MSELHELKVVFVQSLDYFALNPDTDQFVRDRVRETAEMRGKPAEGTVKWSARTDGEIDFGPDVDPINLRERGLVAIEATVMVEPNEESIKELHLAG